jgi:two-component system sporulation sensor kinase B
MKSSIIDSLRKKMLVIVSMPIITCLNMIHTHYLNTGFMNDFRMLPIVLIMIFFSPHFGLLFFLSISGVYFILGGPKILIDLTVFLIQAIAMYSILLMSQRVFVSRKIEISEGIRLFLILILVRYAALIVFAYDIIKTETVFNLIVYPFVELFLFIGILYLIKEKGRILEIEKDVLESEKLKQISQIAASIAHEIRNPITVVKGFTQLIQQGHNRLPSEKIKSYIDLCNSELERAEYIIKDYLSYSKPNQDVLGKINVNDTIRRICTIVSSYSLFNNISLENNNDENIELYIWGYKEKLDQILMNIVKNAIEACSNTESAKVTISAEEINGYVQINVIDNGIGIPIEQLTTIGKAYHTTKTTGTGLGMMVCRKLIDQMNGKLNIQSSKGKGTHIKIQLPTTN